MRRASAVASAGSSAAGSPWGAVCTAVSASAGACQGAGSSTVSAPPYRRLRRRGCGAGRAARRGRIRSGRGACGRRPRRWQRSRRRRPRARQSSRAPSWVRKLPTVTGTELSLDDAVAIASTGDVWLFRGASVADIAIRTVTNAPVNHVGHGRRARRSAAAAVARRAGPLAPRRVDRRAPARGATAQARRRGDDLEAPSWAARVGAPAGGQDRARARGPADGGHPALRRPRLPDQHRAGAPVGHRARAPAPAAVGGGDLLRRAGRHDLPVHGPASQRATAELVRPRALLERRRPGARAAVRARGRDRRVGPGPRRDRGRR